MRPVRFLGLDYGRKRIGVAVSDPLGNSALPIGYVPNDGKKFDRISEIIRERDLSEIVLGLPRSLSGREGGMAKEVQLFAEELKTRTGKPVHLWDERFSTSEAENLLISADVRREKRKEVRDTVAASLILQGFMESRKR